MGVFYLVLTYGSQGNELTLWKSDCWLEIMHVGYNITYVTMYPCLCMVYKYNESMFARNVMLCSEAPTCLFN